MAIYETPKHDGIQIGKRLDRCFKCAKKLARENKQADILEYQEVFKLHLNGIEYVACMDHFQEMLGDYVLIHKHDLTEDEVVELKKDIVDNGTVEEVKAHIEEQVKKKAKK